MYKIYGVDQFPIEQQVNVFVKINSIFFNEICYNII